MTQFRLNGGRDGQNHPQILVRKLFFKEKIMESNQDPQNQSKTPAASRGKIGSLVRLAILIFVFGLAFVFAHSYLDDLEIQSKQASSEFSSNVQRFSRKTKAIIQQKQTDSQPSPQEPSQ